MINPAHFKTGRGWYECPTNPIEHPPKVAVIIGTYVRKGQVETVPGRYRAKEGTDHVHFEENKLSLLKFTLACHEHYKAGVDYEIIIVDNSSPDEEANVFLDNCGYQVLRRENTGFSFGAYEYAWKTFGDRYDYYLFCEQDIVPTKDNWLKDIVLKFLADRDIGAVGNIIEGYRYRDYFTQWSMFSPGLVGKYWQQEPWRQCNLDGMFMFTSSRILKECGLQVTYMKLMDKSDPESWDITPGVNELFWQHPILDRGYHLDSYDDSKHKYTNGICYLDWGTIKAKKYAPLMHGQVMYVFPEMQEHFNWYGHAL